MNDKLQDFARYELKKGLNKCTKEQQHLFKQMYSNDNLNMNINDVVDKMNCDKLDWAMQQVERSKKENQ